jgi:hypothetical protein
MRLFKRIITSATAVALSLSTVAIGPSSIARATAPVPTPGTATIIIDRVGIIFNDWPANPAPTPSMFVVKANGVAVATTSIEFVGSIVHIFVTPGAIVQGMTVTISYVAPPLDNTLANAALQDSRGNDAPAFTDFPVTNMQPPARATTTTTTTTVAPVPMGTQSVSWDSDPASEAETDANTVGYMPLSPGNIIITDQVGFVLDAKNGIKPKIRMKSYAGLIKMKIASSYKVAGKTVKYSCTFAPFGSSKKSTKVAWKWYSPKKACILPAALLASVRNGSSTLTATASWPRIWLATGKKVRPDGSKIAARKLTYTIRNRP